MSDPRALNVLFLCPGNSGRSIMAEATLNALGRGRFLAYSAGITPIGRVHPFALELLEKNRLPTDYLRSKSWQEFAHPAAPRMDFVFTVGDGVSRETVPLLPGTPMTAHWGVPDPLSSQGSDADQRRAFFAAYNQLHHRLLIFVNLPMEKLDRRTLQNRLHEIGRD